MMTGGTTSLALGYDYADYERVTKAIGVIRERKGVANNSDAVLTAVEWLVKRLPYLSEEVMNTEWTTKKSAREREVVLVYDSARRIRLELALETIRATFGDKRKPEAVLLATEWLAEALLTGAVT
jgi:hypothetical protein